MVTRLNTHFTIIVDTREKHPLWKLGNCLNVSVEQFKLEVGDYTTYTLLNRYHVERKSPSDLYHSLIQDHDRFRKELIRAHDLSIRMDVVVESTTQDFFAKGWSTRPLKITSAQLCKMINTIESRYKVRFIFCNGRWAMRRKVLDLFNEAPDLLMREEGIL